MFPISGNCRLNWQRLSLSDTFYLGERENFPSYGGPDGTQGGWKDCRARKFSVDL